MNRPAALSIALMALLLTAMSVTVSTVSAAPSGFYCHGSCSNSVQNIGNTDNSHNNNYNNNYGNQNRMNVQGNANMDNSCVSHSAEELLVLL
ncbi:hypothetical protein BV898_17732 [Hypsibius exemplaris]|uniref:Uncharacterized protein n=1 Tax=Hypsibius exemplaris TaxID=2072580 RepID=A0A9X6NG22_HYPEX|nr:hypothetical protein BV898_17732 [Hypsibius exemplaris]